MAEHTCNVIAVKLEKHPNADSLSIVKIGNSDFQCIVRTEEWRDGDLAAYIEPDSVVPDTPQFSFLNGKRRIKACKLRGEWSMGLLVPAPPGSQVGDNCMTAMGIEHYEPEVHGGFSTGGENVSPPSGNFPVYDVENFRKYSRLFVPGEEVIVTEKIHGANSRFVCINDKMFCGSHRNWKKEDPNNLWWKAYNDCPVLQSWCYHHQNLVVYAEVFGQVQNLKYGARPGQIFIAVFDILTGDQPYNQKWLNSDEAHKIGAPLPWVPLVYRGPFDKEKIIAMAEENSSIPGANHHREGVVIKPVQERFDGKIGRVQLKIVGNKYLNKSE